MVARSYEFNPDTPTKLSHINLSAEPSAGIFGIAFSHLQHTTGDYLCQM